MEKYLIPWKYLLQNERILYLLHNKNIFYRIDFFALMWLGAMPAEGLYLLIARVATAYYFAHFLIILPLLGFKEKTLPLPFSISDPVLGGSANLSMAKSDKKEG